MKKMKRLTAVLISILLLATTVAAFAAYAEDSNLSEESSSSVEEVDSSSSSEQEEESSSSEQEEESSSSEQEEESSSSEQKEESSSSSDESSSSEEESSSSKTPSSSEDDTVFVQTIVDDTTGITLGLSQPNEDLDIIASFFTSDNEEYKDVYAKLSSESKGQELLRCYELELVGDDEFEAKLTVMLPVEGTLIGRDMNVLFYDGDRVKSNTKPVGEAVELSTTGNKKDNTELGGDGIIKISETLVSGRKYYFAVCEVADFVSVSHGIGLLGIAAIIVGVMALASGGLLAFLWIRYYKQNS